MIRLAWSSAFNEENRRVALDKLIDMNGTSVEISTLFIEPKVYETVIFGGDFHNHLERYATQDEAETRHNQIVEKIKTGRHIGAS